MQPNLERPDPVQEESNDNRSNFQRLLDEIIGEYNRRSWVEEAERRNKKRSTLDKIRGTNKITADDIMRDVAQIANQMVDDEIESQKLGIVVDKTVSKIAKRKVDVIMSDLSYNLDVFEAKERSRKEKETKLSHQE
ncbi:MAG: hypothetical protein AAB513_01690 [Patescibacteria group bacterium]